MAIFPGSSGGGLFNAEGELVGITTFYLKESQNLNFALPVEWIAEAVGKKIRGRPIVEAPGAPAPSIEEIWSPAAPAPESKPKESWFDRAEALEKAQDWQGLLAWSRRWTQAVPDNGSAWFNLGFAYQFLGRHHEAIAAFREALRLKPDDADAYYYLGFSYGKPDRYREAIAAYREALRLKPDAANAWTSLGLAYALSGNRSAALEAVKELRRYDPQKADEVFNLIMKP